ncbi:MAG: ABC transporter transmembrane domain-containing protein [Thermodesulfobacteriota bacterium]
MWTSKKKNRAFNTLFTYGGHHSTWLYRGTAATIGVVFFRLLMPWPLRGVIEVVFPQGSHKGWLLMSYFPEWGNPVVMLGGIYVLLALGLGLAEMSQRVNLKRFASQTAHDMRAAAVEGARIMPLHKRTATGDIVSRIIGDSARIKAGLSGVMVHGLQNGMLFLAACAVMAYVSFWFALIFLLSGLIALYIGVYTSAPVADTASKLRRKEGNYAAAIADGLDAGVMNLNMDDINWSSARKTVRITAMIARSSVYVHVILAASVALALWIGAMGVKSGSLAPGDLFIFIAYAMTVHRRMVQVGRQIARSGKVLACADRIGVYSDYMRGAAEEIGAAGDKGAVPLTSGLRLERAGLDAGQGREGRPRLRRLDLLLEPRTRVAVVGPEGCGKSSLLKILSGVEVPDRGRVYWDGEKIFKKEGGLASRVAYMPQDPILPPVRVWKHLGLQAEEKLSAEDEKILENIGVSKIIETFTKGLEQKIASNAMTRNEARLLRLAGILLRDTSSVWLLDNPLADLGGKKARLCIDEILARSGERLLVIALPGSRHVKYFDRVISMRKGRVHFDGTPAEFEQWKLSEAEVDKKD